MKRSFHSLILIFALAILFVSGCSTPERNVVGPVPTGTALPATAGTRGLRTTATTERTPSGRREHQNAAPRS